MVGCASSDNLNHLVCGCGRVIFHDTAYILPGVCLTVTVVFDQWPCWRVCALLSAILVRICFLISFYSVTDQWIIGHVRTQWVAIFCSHCFHVVFPLICMLCLHGHAAAKTRTCTGHLAPHSLITSAKEILFLLHVCLSVCLSVCHCGIVSKWIHILWNFFHYLVGLSF